MRFRAGLPNRRRHQILIVIVMAGISALVICGAPTLWTQYHLASARSALKNRDAEAALAHLEHVGRFQSDHPECHFLLARTCRRLGRFAETGEHLQRAWKLGYDVETVRREQWLALAQAGRLREVERRLPHLLQDQRGDGAEICEAFVDGYFATYRFDQAFAVLRAWEADFPDDPQPQVYRGLFHEHSERPSDAVECYRRALQLAPKRHDIRYRLATQLALLHDYAAAEEHFRVCLADKPEDPEIRSAWGTCLEGMGRTDEAWRVLQQVIESHPTHYETRLALGRLEYGRERVPQALDWLIPLSSERPTDTEARYLLAQALQADGRSDAAKEHFQFVAEARQHMAEIDRLRDQVRHYPQDVELRYRIGAALVKYDVPEHGAAWLRSVLEFDPNHGPTHAALAEYYLAIGRSELAEEHTLAAGLR